MIKKEDYIKDTYQWEDLLAIVHHLRQPDGCPWDREQTYETMTKCVMDEAGEVVEAVKQDDFINLKEELGDLLLQVLMYSEIGSERGDFTLDEVVDEIAKKLIRRHPHVFGDEGPAKNAEEGLKRWNAMKLKEKENRLEEYERLYTKGRIRKELVERQRKIYEEAQIKMSRNKM
jgi:MazG family protein